MSDSGAKMPCFESACFSTRQSFVQTLSKRYRPAKGSIQRLGSHLGLCPRTRTWPCLSLEVTVPYLCVKLTRILFLSYKEMFLFLYFFKRMALDDNHASVVLACAKVIQCLLSCSLNENFFDLMEVLVYSFYVQRS